MHHREGERSLHHDLPSLYLAVLILLVFHLLGWKSIPACLSVLSPRLAFMLLMPVISPGTRVPEGNY